jgi:hypothetical protein
MLKFSADLLVDRPVDQVFAWLTNPKNQGKFDKSSVEMELLTPGPWQAGSQFREVRPHVLFSRPSMKTSRPGRLANRSPR